MQLKIIKGITILALVVLAGCNSPVPRLPILGTPTMEGKDTLYPSIANFSFTDQDSNTVNNLTFANKIYVADFMFLSCPTICPIMTKEMYDVYQQFAKDNRVLFISHSINPERDSIPALKAYATSMRISSNKWHFVTGNQDSILSLCENSYFSAAYPDSTSPGGFTHSGGLLLIDKDRHIRGVYNSTKAEETQRLIMDIKTLLKEQF